LAEETEQQRTERLFDSKLTPAALLPCCPAALLPWSEGYAAAWRVLSRTVALDKAIPAGRRYARSLLASFVDLRRGEADRIYRGADAALIDLD